MHSGHLLRILTVSLCVLALVGFVLVACGGSNGVTTTSATIAMSTTATTIATTTTTGGQTQSVEVPMLGFMTEADAIGALSAIGLASDVAYVPGYPAEEGRVIGQDPTPGNMVPVGTTVLLEVGVYEDTGLLTVPDVVGWYLADAEEELDSRGFNSDVHLVPDLMYSGSVVAQDPLGGALAAHGTAVRLDVQRYAIELANLVGMTKEEVEDYCSGYHLALGISYVPSLPDDVGLVLSQDPAVGTVLMEDVGEVAVTIGTFPQISITLPTVPIPPSLPGP
jgi:beta-lactam-binding protein with PASTA domain